jgi:hypothetical protein
LDFRLQAAQVDKKDRPFGSVRTSEGHHRAGLVSGIRDDDVGEGLNCAHLSPLQRK